ncbi:hypothetical protein [Deinococcus frigens]|uniref:hypothetical protein n=1 Tax=Deinococcus frigens TaxID=249403 RepID=UPI0004954210|nr:hypothetical protein [Deinococcus frigens]
MQRHVQGWPREAVLAWLWHWGTVDSWQYRGFPVTYAFRSRCGEVTHFILQDDQFTFLGDHTIAIPPE